MSIEKLRSKDSREEVLENRLIDSFEKYMEYDPSVNGNFDYWEILEDRARRNFDLLIDYNPDNAWLYVVSMISCLGHGLNEPIVAKRFICCTARALELARPDELIDIKDSLDFNYNRFREKAVSLEPSIRELANDVASCIKDKNAEFIRGLDYLYLDEIYPIFY